MLTQCLHLRRVSLHIGWDRASVGEVATAGHPASQVLMRQTKHHITLHYQTLTPLKVPMSRATQVTLLHMETQ